MEKNKYILSALAEADPTFNKALIKYGNDNVIRVLHEILHNLLVGNIPLTGKQLNSLAKHKKQLRKIHHSCSKSKCIKKTRKIFIKQSGNNPILLAVLRIGAGILGEKLLEKSGDYIADKIKKFTTESK